MTLGKKYRGLSFNGNWYEGELNLMERTSVGYLAELVDKYPTGEIKESTLVLADTLKEV